MTATDTDLTAADVAWDLEPLLPAPGDAGLDDLLDRLAADEFDLVGVGRALLANYNWAELVEAGEFAALKPFDKALLKQLY